MAARQMLRLLKRLHRHEKCSNRPNSSATNEEILISDADSKSPTRPTPGCSTSTFYSKLIDCIPLDTIVYGFSYGSGVFQQEGEVINDKMIDFILVTKDPLAFHQMNLTKNPRHYSAYFRFLPPKTAANFQEKFAARIFYNTRIPSNGRLIKYGVIGMRDFEDDLLEWKWLYAAGRLHKPVVNVIDVSTEAQNLEFTIAENRRCALEASLLVLPEKFSVRDLFEAITQISYRADVRMRVAEDKNKVSKLVSGSMDAFKGIYLPLIQNDKRLYLSADDDILEQDCSTSAIYHRLMLLPSRLQIELQQHLHRHNFSRQRRDIEEDLFTLAHTHDIQTRVVMAIDNIVANSSLKQTLCNALTAGLMKALLYGGNKVKKRFSQDVIFSNFRSK